LVIIWSISSDKKFLLTVQSSLFRSLCIDECLETVGRAGSKVYSALDCSSAFWQLELRPSDRPFTAFTIPGKGQYHWKTCPQGLMGAPASFSRLMDMLLADAENVLTYIDDVLVHSRSHEEHLRHLADAINKIGAANLRLNPKKCVFGWTRWSTWDTR
jgi:hypothetical protein